VTIDFGAPAPSALLDLLHRAATGSFPPVDLATTHLPSPQSPADAVCTFFGHHVLASDVDTEWVASWTTRDPFALSDVRFLAALGERLGTEPGILDAVFAAIGNGAVPEAVGVIETEERSHPRVERALRYRQPSTVRVFHDVDRCGVLVMGRGLGGRLEAAYEVDEHARGRGIGSLLLRAARALAPHGEPVFVQISPGNVWSMRALGHDHPHWRPVGGEILFLRR
jgi:GNAT superfamily N-acetyltransferase